MARNFISGGVGCGYPVPTDPASSVGCRSTVATHSRLTECQIRFLVLFGHIFSSTDLRRFGKKGQIKHYELSKEHVRNASVEPSKPECRAFVGRHDVYSCGPCVREGARSQMLATVSRRAPTAAQRKERRGKDTSGPCQAPLSRGSGILFFIIHHEICNSRYVLGQIP